ncbi:MAG: hypothetical protein LQ338_006641 [Usnochroma carphineum]|nr:MAG: hypothetical protein LQ338_006641 [Usnochroma carphineum]
MATVKIEKTETTLILRSNNFIIALYYGCRLSVPASGNTREYYEANSEVLRRLSACRDHLCRLGSQLSRRSLPSLYYKLPRHWPARVRWCKEMGKVREKVRALETEVGELGRVASDFSLSD